MMMGSPTYVPIASAMMTSRRAILSSNSVSFPFFCCAHLSKLIVSLLSSFFSFFSFSRSITTGSRIHPAKAS